MRPFHALAACAVVALAVTTATRAAVYTYDGSVRPDASTTPPFSYAIFGDTGWSTDGDVLTISTWPYEGIWFGKHASYNTVPWSLGTSADGNQFSIRAAVANQLSTDWQVYMLDGTSYAQMSFFPDHASFFTDDGQGHTITTDIPLDGLAFHDYSFFMKNGFVAYSVDGLPRVTGYAIPAPNAQYLIIGDGSGTSYGTTGSFRIDSITLDTAPTGLAPEPAALPLAAPALFAAARRRRTT